MLPGRQDRLLAPSGPPTLAAQPNPGPLSAVPSWMRAIAPSVFGARMRRGTFQISLEDWSSETMVPPSAPDVGDAGLAVEPNPGGMGIVVTDQDGTITDCCRHIEWMFGCPRARLIGRALRRLLPEIGPVSQLLDSLAHARRLLGRGPEVVQTTAARPNGSRFPVALAFCAWPGAGSSLHFVLSDASPLTRRIEQIQLLATTVEQTGDAVAVTDSAGVVTYVNRAFEDITGYRRAEVLGKTMAVLKSGLQSSAFYHSLWSTIIESPVNG